MTEPLKNSFGAAIPQKIAAMIRQVHPEFNSREFVPEILENYAALSLTERARKITFVMHKYLPEDFSAAVSILIKSLGPKLESTESFGMEPFIYLPHVYFVAEFGLQHFDESMGAQYELTQRFTAEFSIRPFLEKYQSRTLSRLREWATDKSPHVRRLVSEGTRPRLPWAPRLVSFQKDPRPVLPLLDALKDDPSPYVRRSVANNLNDIGKDHPEILTNIARRWAGDAPASRMQLIKHALRHAVKAGNADALAILGAGSAVQAGISRVCISPTQPVIGTNVQIEFELRSTSKKTQRVLANLRIHFVKASGKTASKVFKAKSAELLPGTTVVIQKTISLANLTTRKHYPGKHIVEASINGRISPLGSFMLHRGER